MPDVPRPPPQETLMHRLLSLRDRLSRVSPGDVTESPAKASLSQVDNQALPPRTPISLLAMIAAGSALLTVGAVLSWQHWSERSAAPLDDRLPYLVEQPDAASEAPQTPIAGSDESDATNVATPSGTETPQASFVEQVVDVGSDETDSNTPIIVHVSGAVRRPGIVTLKDARRINDAVVEAGGALDEADLARVNLADFVADGSHVHVPFEGADIPPVMGPIAGSQATPWIGPSSGSAPAVPELFIDLNEATQDQLEQLPGVGPATAMSIISTRTQRGPFLAVDELLDVRGIGTAKLDAIRPHVFVVGR